MSSWSSVLERAQKIRELRDRAGTPEEAAVAAEKLQQLLIKHQIAEYELNRHKTPAERRQEVVAVEFNIDEGLIKGRRISKGWRRTVAHTAAMAHGCESVHYDGTNRIAYVGYKTNVEAAWHMFHYLKNTIIDLTLAGYAEHQAEEGASATSPRIWHQSFADGAIDIIRRRLEATRAQAEQEAVQTSQALVIMNQDVSDEYARRFPNAKPSKGRIIRDSNAYCKGKNAGQNVPLGKEVGSGNTKAIR